MTEFGKDILCIQSLRTGRYATGILLAAQEAYHRLTTPRGMLRGGEDEQNFGTDISTMVGGVGSAVAAARLPDIVSAELSKSERIESVRTVVAVARSGPGTVYELTINATTADGPFRLQLAVSDVTVELLGLTVEPT